MSNLIGRWNLNGTIDDISGNGRHGVLLGTPSISTSEGIIKSECYEFNSVGKHCILPSEFLPYGSDWSVSFFLKFNSAQVSYNSPIRYMPGGYQFFVDSSQNCYLKSIVDNTQVAFLWGLVVDKWYHVCFRSSNNKVDIFLDGVKTVSNYFTPNADTSVGRDFYVGSYAENSNARFQDFRVYDGLLSDKEIYQMSKALCLHYDFDDVEEPAVNLINPKATFAASTTDWTIEKIDDYTTKITSLKDNPSVSVWGDVALHQSSYTIEADTNFTYSCEAYSSNSNIYPSSNGFGILSLYGNNKWVKSTSYNAPFGNQFAIRVPNASTIKKGDFIIIKNLQLEKKDHATPFVNGTRDQIIVRDKSDYGNDSLPLTVATTPAFVDDCKMGKQSIKFDRVKTLKAPKLFYDNLNQSWTCCGFVKIENVLEHTQFNNFNLGNMITRGSTKRALLYINSGINDSYSYSDNPNKYITQSEWFHIAYVLDTKALRCEIYINGVLSGVSSNYSITDIPAGFGAETIFGTGLLGLMDDLHIYATALTAEDIKEIYQSRANLDDKGNLKVGNLISYENKQRIMDYSWWNYTGYVSDRITGGFSLNGTASENYFDYDTDPWGKSIIVWRARGNDTSSDDDGGWNCIVPINSTKKYRYSVWIKRSVLGNGKMYLGCNSVESTSGITQDNPYFHIVNAGSAGGEMQTEWQLFVYYIFPSGYTDSEEPNQGVYKVNQGKVHDGSINRNCSSPVRWNPGATGANFRTYLYYSTDPTTRQEWCYPRIDLCDGTEPSIDELLSGYDSRNYDSYMKYGNVKNVFSVKENADLELSNISEVGVTEGLIAHYPLNGDARDYSGNGNDGIVVGAAVAAGLGQKCYYFAKSVNERIIIPTNPIFDTKHLSIQLWVKPNDVSSPLENNFLCKQKQYEVRFLSGELYFAVETTDPAGWFWFNTGIRVNENEWVNFYFKYNAISFDVYKNGVLVVSAPHNKGELVSGTGSLQLGNRETVPGSSNGFKGSLQDVRIYNRALTPEEVLINYNLTKADKTAMIQAENGTTYVGQIKED